MQLADIRALTVLGLGRSGRPAALLAARRLSGVVVTALEDEHLADEQIAGLRAAGVAVHCGPELELPQAVDVLVKSPGVPNEHRVVVEALRRGVPVWSEVEFAARFMSNRFVGVTGTNGKTTTTALLGALFADAGLPVAVGGNIGNAISEMPDSIDSAATVVAELSSFQLEHIEEFRAAAGVLLNLSEDHLDRHGSYAAYEAAKLRLLANQAPGDAAVLNADDPVIAGLAAARPEAFGRGRRLWFSSTPGRDDVAAGVSQDGVLWLAASGVAAGGGPVALCRREQLALKGDHNLQNSLAAALTAAAAGVPPAAMATTLRAFAGVAHRLQVVAEVAGVTYVNDSKATNPDATLKALTAYPRRVHLILGGYEKGSDFAALAAATEGRVVEALLIGTTADRLAEAFAARQAANGSATAWRHCGDLETAVAAAAATAVAGDVVLLSPACASWDQYPNYEARGAHFVELVEALP